MKVIVLPQAADEFEDATARYNDKLANQALHRTAARRVLLRVREI